MRKLILLALVTLLSVTLWGCGSNRSSSSTSGGDSSLADAETLGITNCVTCHSAAAPETANWLTSAHGNPNKSPGGPHDETSSCQVCHNQLLDGENVVSAFTDILIGTDGSSNPVYANTPRSIVSCESCHGGGQFHSGVGPIPYPRPDWEQCVQCHDYTGVRHPEYPLASNVGASAHNNSDDLHASTTRCQRCHTVEGSYDLAAYTGDADVMHLMDEDQDDVAPIDLEENLHPVTCAACHVPHTDELRADTFIVNDNSLAAGNWDPNGSGTADQFDFCTSCHTYYNQDDVLIGSGSTASGTAPFYHNTAWYRIITTTHYDDPTTLSGQGNEDLGAVPPIINKIEGYVIRQTVNGVANPDPCFDCHGHELRANTSNADDLDGSDADHTSTPYNGWAKSAHAGKLLDKVFADVAAIDCTGSPSESRGRCEEQTDAAMAAYVSDETGAGWSHYNWDQDSRQGCQECHTATGAANYLDDPATYDATANDFSHLVDWAADPTVGSPQNEMLYCWGCHSDAATGDLRNPGAIERPYSVGGTAVTLPDVGNSNVCINCHGARGNMEEYGDVMEDPSTDFTGLNAGFGPGTANVTEAHYLVAAATIYAADTRIGYEYSVPGGALLDYAPVSYFAHDGIGLNNDAPETGSGPCAACHMETAETHTFMVVGKNDSGVITALNATSCITCHDGSHGAALEAGSAAAAAFLEEEAEGYHEALEILVNALDALGIAWTGGYPYFDTSVAGSWINEGNFGAAHNYNYLHHEPGAYAHNRIYAKRLIFDSLDWLDNYTLDGTITIDAATYPAADAWLGSGAARP